MTSNPEFAAGPVGERPKLPDLHGIALQRLAAMTMRDSNRADETDDPRELRRILRAVARRAMRTIATLDDERIDMSNLRRRLAPPDAREVGADAIREGIDFVHLPLSGDQLDRLRDGETVRIEIDPDPAFGTPWPTVVVLRQAAGAINPNPSRRRDDS